MKKFLILAAIAVMAASCNTNLDTYDDGSKDEQAVSFSAYLNRGVTTKAGQAGDLTTDNLKLATAGFGVFGYYTADQPYAGVSAPNFMYNEKVTYDNTASAWVYAPVKYWPNEFGAAASSDEVDRLTFFAYAPYVEVTPSNGAVTGSNASGIVALSRNSVTGDPYVKYVVSMNPAEGVDLCWGVAADDFKNSVDGTNNNVSKGAPYIDLIKPRATDKINMEFNHALAALNVQIDAAVDATAPGNDINEKTKVYVRSISFEGLATWGSLNLNSTVAAGPIWTDYAGAGTPVSETLTVFDGRRDGKEGVTGATASNENPLGLNPSIIQTETATAGVTKTAVNLFNSTTATDGVYVIPTNEPLKVTIVYDVETEDDKLSTLLSDGVTHGSTVENAISKNIQTGTPAADLTLQAGLKYTIKLHLGLTSVKFDASVTTWGTGASSDLDLPQNN